MHNTKKLLIAVAIGILNFVAYARQAPDELYRGITDGVVVTKIVFEMLDKKDPPDDDDKDGKK
jgi:hypothetical protein